MKDKHLKRLEEIYNFTQKHYEDMNPEIIAIWKFLGDLIKDIKDQKLREHIDSVLPNEDDLGNEITVIALLSGFMTKDFSTKDKAVEEIETMAKRICKVFEN